MASLRQLQALMLIGQTGSFTRAADSMTVTQSAVSLLIRELEREMATPLVHRGRTVRLTDAGKRLERAARRASHEIEEAKRDICGQEDGRQTVIRLAAGSLSAATFVPTAIAYLMNDPTLRIRVEVLDGPSVMLADMLISGDADVGIGSIDSPIRRSATLKSELLASDTLCAVTSANAAFGPVLARLPDLSWEVLADLPLILVGCQGGQWQQLLLKRMLGTEQAYKVHEAQLYSTAVAMAREGLGVAILPSASVRNLDKAFCIRPIRETEASWSTYWVVRRESSVPTNVLERLKTALLRFL